MDAKEKQHKLPLNGIDAPEKKQALGAKSKAMLGELVADILQKAFGKKSHA